jgi:DNA-binding GntR family transcriptional regulator
VPEAELAKHLGISRPSLREAIRILAREGLILVKHGIGTFISKDTKPMLGSLELMRSMTDLIRAAGGEPSYRDLSITLDEPSAHIAAELELGANTKVGLISRVRLIDDTPFVVAREYVVLNGAGRNFEALSKFEGGSLYAFMKQDLGITISHSKARISAVAADGHMAKVLGLRKGAPLLLMHEIHYGFDGKPVLLAINYHNTQVVEFTSMRSGAPV